MDSGVDSCDDRRPHDEAPVDGGKGSVSTLALPQITAALTFMAGLFLGIIAFVEIGRRLGQGRTTNGLAAVERAVFGLMALLMAFTFSSAAIRFETRRNMLVQEAEDIRTAFMRLDLLPAEAQPKLREDMRRYVDGRLAVYHSLGEAQGAEAAVARVAEIQRDLWMDAVAATRASDTHAASLVIPALDRMFTIATTRTIGLQTHQHAVVLGMLAVVMLACSLLAGFSMGEAPARSWLHVLCFAAVMTVAFYVILDLEWPRLGLIRIDWMDRFLEEVRRSMG
jgi:hypothetical protein